MLARMALEKIFGEDYMDPSAFVVELKVPAKGRVDECLKGLLWNLATYQDGV